MSTHQADELKRIAIFSRSISATATKENSQVTNGTFAVEFDFDSSAFTDTAHTLAIGVRAGTSRGTWRSSAPGAGLS